MTARETAMLDILERCLPEYRFHAQVGAIALEEGFAINTRKTRMMRAGVRQQVTGIVVNRHPNIARAMYSAQLVDEGVMRAWIVSMGRRGSNERVAHLICELYLRARNIGLTHDGDFALPMSQIVLADALGMTPVHMNRVLKELRLAGAMRLGRGSVTIVDPEKLIQIAGFDANYLHRRLRQTA